MRILMITSEAVPFAKSGGLADMVSALSLALKKEGQDVRILMPLYDDIDRSELESLATLQVDMVYRTEEIILYTTLLGEDSIPVYFIGNRKYFGRKGIYGPTPASSYPDNAHRYSLLSASFEAVCLSQNWIPQILHSHDWPAGPVPLYLNRAEEDLKESATVFTIHNMGYQGCYDRRDLPWMGLNLEDTRQYNMMKDDYINFLKTGIENHDRITTVSPSYAEEIKTLAYGHGLDQSLNHRGAELRGILNGVDYDSWNPETDVHIKPDNFSASRMKAKGRCKARLQEASSLERDQDIPLFAMITRLVEQKGMEELCRPGFGILEDFCTTGKVQLVILGTGEPWVEKELRRLAALLPNLSVTIAYSEEMSHLIEAGADFFIMPSHYEPCGLNQLYSLRYGTIPVVRQTGGLADSVTDPQAKGGWSEASGFVYRNADPVELRGALDRAVECWYERPDRISLLRQNGMKLDFSWRPSALSYMDIYREALSDRESG